MGGLVKRSACGLAWLLLLAAIASGCSALRPVEQRFDRLDALLHSSAERDPARIAAEFHKSFAHEYAAGRLSKRTERELDLLFRAASAVATFGEPKAADMMQAVLRALESRAQAATRHYADLLHHLVKDRRFAEAERLHANAGGAPVAAPPRLVDRVEPGWLGPTELVPSPEGNELVRQKADLSGVRIVISWHPDCHFSRDAYRGISAHADLRALFARHGKLLAPVDSAYGLDSLQAWNRSHPDATVGIAFRAEEWPALDLSQMPVFHFLRDGELLAKVVGWPEEGRAEELLAAAKAAGMLDAVPNR